jgi:hypothetical protein
MNRHAIAALLGAALLTLVAASCGGDDGGGEQVASLGDDDGGAASTTTTSEERDPEEAMLAFARCMREHGVDVPDPDSSGRVRIRGALGGRSPAEREKFQEAQKACEDELGEIGPRISDEDRAELQEAMLAYAKCMRGEGLDFPDPQFDGGGVIMRAGDPDSPEFEAADEKCRHHLQAVRERFRERRGS